MNDLQNGHQLACNEYWGGCEGEEKGQVVAPFWIGILKEKREKVLKGIKRENGESGYIYRKRNMGIYRKEKENSLSVGKGMGK